jgi:hypothetical protein
MTTPTLSRRRLGHELRQLREAAQLTMSEVAGHLDCSTSKISRIETARVAATVRDVRDMLELYRTTGQQRESLLQLAREARRKESRWHEYGDIPDVRDFIRLEDAAKSLCVYELLLIPGLLQTAEYTRLILAANHPELHRNEIERYVRLRRVRQSILIRRDPLVLETVIDEAAIHRLSGTRQVVQAQLNDLVAVARRPNITLQVLPFSAGIHAGMISPFTILRFPDPADPDVVHLEHAVGDLFLTNVSQVQSYKVRFERLKAMALSPGDSQALLSNLSGGA